MSRDRFDDLVTGHLRATAPHEAPARILDGTLDRIVRTPQRGAGRRLGRAGGLLAAGVVVALAVAAGTELAGLIDGPVGNDPSRIPSVAPGESPRSSATAAPSATHPPPAATEPATSSDALLLRLMTFNETTDRAPILPVVIVAIDGTVVWRPVSTTEFAGYLTRRLTPDGLAQLREILFGEGLLDADARYRLEPLPDTEPPGRGGFEHRFVVGEGTDEIVVISAGWMSDQEEAMYYQPAPERRALDELAWQLRDPEALLGEAAWEGSATAYQPDSYFLVLTPHPEVQPSGNPDVAGLPLPIDGPLLAFDENSDGSPGIRCGEISHDDASAIIDSLIGLGVDRHNSVGMDRATVASLDWADGNGTVDLWVLPRLAEVPECQGPF
jgi:hypothetical protein